MNIFLRPGWAPDGSITVQGTDLARRSGLFRVDSGSGRTTPILVCEQFGTCVQASWTPDGQFLVYRRDTPHEVAVVLRDMLRSEDRVIESVGRPDSSSTVSAFARRHEDHLHRPRRAIEKIDSVSAANWRWRAAPAVACRRAQCIRQRRRMDARQQATDRRQGRPDDRGVMDPADRRGD